MISDAEIQRLANEASYRLGCRYQKNGAVTVTRRDSGRSETYYEAEVEGSGPFAYFVTARISGNRVTSYYCECPAADLYDGACKHVVALLKEIQSSETPQPKRGESALSENARKLFAAYAPETMKSEIAAPLRLVPKFCVGFEYRSQTMWLEFRIGRERLYVLRSIQDFLRQMDSGRI